MSFTHSQETKDKLKKLAIERSTPELVNRILQSEGYKQRKEKYKWKQIVNSYSNQQELLELLNTKQIKELAALWNCSVDCVRTVRKRLGLGKKNLSQLDIIKAYTRDQLEEMYLVKFDRHLKVMAEALNVYQDTLSHVFKRLGIEQNPHHPSEYQEVKDALSKKAILRMSNEEFKRNITTKLTKLVNTSTGESLVDFCKKYGAPESTIRHLVQRMGIENAFEYVVKNSDENGMYKQYISSLELDFISLFQNSDIIAERWCKNVDGIEADVRPDIRLSFKGHLLFVDIHGLYYHCDILKSDKHYHFNRRQIFENVGISYFQFFEDEIRDKPNIVRSMVLNNLGLSKDRYFARQLDILDTSSQEAKTFLNTNHLMGYSKSQAIGLYKDAALVSCMSFKEFPDKIEIIRFASKLNTICVGGFGRLVSYLKKFNKPIVSFCDLRYSSGKSYKALNFREIRTTLGWNWTNLRVRFNRLYCKAGNGKTEKENATEKNLYKIYDAGQRKYILDFIPQKETNEKPSQ